MDTIKTAADASVDAAAQSIFEGVLSETDDQPPEEGDGEAPAPQEAEPAGDDSEEFDAEAAEALEEEDEPEDEPEDDEDEQVEESPPPAPESYTVKVDGEEVSVTLDELRAGYSRTASWTRKSQELARQRKAFEQEDQAVRQERMKYAELLGTLEQQLQAQLPQEPTTDDPREWIHFQRKTQELEKVRAEQGKLQETLQAQWQADRDRITSQENEKLAQIFPEWQEESVALGAKQDLVSYATGLGFDREELENVYDHRVVVLLAKAKAYDELEVQKKTVQKKAKSSPVLKPGQPRSRSKSTKARRKTRSQRDKLRDSGRVDDAAAILYDQLD
jgi:hypothetical protein